MKGRPGLRPWTPPEGAALWTPAKGRGPWNPSLIWGAGWGTEAGLGCRHRAGKRRRDGGSPDRPQPPSLAPKQNGWIPKASPLVGVQGAKPPGGFQGGALTLLWFT